MDETATMLSVQKLLELWNPFVDEPKWPECSRPVSEANILKAIAQNNIESTGYVGILDKGPKEDWDCARHESRIAFLVVHGWEDAIYVEAEREGEGEWPVWDGHHRFVAAVIRGDLGIKAETSGYLDIIENLLFDRHASPE